MGNWGRCSLFVIHPGGSIKINISAYNRPHTTAIHMEDFSTSTTTPVSTSSSPTPSSMETSNTTPLIHHLLIHHLHVRMRDLLGHGVEVACNLLVGQHCCKQVYQIQPGIQIISNHLPNYFLQQSTGLLNESHSRNFQTITLPLFCAFYVRLV